MTNNKHKDFFRKLLNRTIGRVRRPVAITILALGGVVVCLLITLVILAIALSSDHKRAVREYNENNWVNVISTLDGKEVVGCANGVDFSYIDDGRIYPGVSINGVELGGMDYAAAREALIPAVQELLSTVNMSITVENACLVLTATDFKITTNVNDLIYKALQVGRESLNDYKANYDTQQRAATDGIDFTIECYMDEESVRTKIHEVAEFVNTEPVEPYVTVRKRLSANSDDISSDSDSGAAEGGNMRTVYAENGVAIADMIFNEGTNGYILNEEAMLSQIITAFNNRQYTTEITTTLEETKPTGTVEALKESITQLTVYSTTFEDSSFNRRRNVQKGAGIINGMVLNPGEEMSFNDYVGPRTEAGGWLPAAGISGGKEYVDSPGGGICQVSTTLYNALLLVGPDIEIVYRQHHSWPSSYVPYGLDATVDTYGPDFKWKNVSDNPMYVFAYANTEAGDRVISVYVFGVADPEGRSYKVWAETVDEIKPGEPLIINEPLWPSGYTRQTIKERTGYKAIVYRALYDKDGSQIGETQILYEDYYSPVRAEIHVGTGASTLPKPTD